LKRSGVIYIVSAPSGAGKTSLLRKVLSLMTGLRDSISYTTRPRRPEERDGVDYHFIDDDLFRRRVGTGFFAENAMVHGHRYGTAREDLKAIIERGDDVVMDIDVQGAIQIKGAFPEAVTLFVLPPSINELERRLRRRGTEEEASVQRRLGAARMEIGSASRYDFLVINDDLDRAAAAVCSIIEAERHRTSRQDLDGTIREILSSKAPGA
jgi:guanylate kinase